MEFRVLGPIDVEVDGTRIALGGPQQRVVLALLVLRANEVVSIDTLRHGLWAGTVPSSADNVLRTYVSRLRQALRVGDAGAGGGAAVAGRPVVSRAPGYVLEIDPDQVDAHRFESLVDRARDARSTRRPHEALTALRQALALWRGDALADLSGWACLRSAIVRLEEMRLAAVEDRIDAELELGHHAQVVGELDTLTRAHPFRERIWGQLILALYRSNRQTAALAAYQAARSALVDQMGIEPGPALQALERDVLAQSDQLLWRPPAASQPTTVTGPEHPAPGPSSPRRSVPLQAALVDTRPDPSLVGRDPEMALLRSSLDQLGSGDFGVLFVAGPPGIGKTALARWFASEAHRAGATVLFGRADETSGSPFQALEEAIDHWVRYADEAEVASLDRSDAAHLARMVPRLSERRAGLADVPIADSLTSRRRLFDALMRWLEALAARRPVVVVLDDMHWADAATLAALRHALRHPPSAGAVVVAIYRDTETDHVPELASMVAGTDDDGRVRHLRLGGLSDDDVGDLLRRETGCHLGPEGHRFAEQLGRWTGGNPLFVLEMLRHLVEQGALGGDTADARWPGPAALDGTGVPARVTELIDQRLRRLPTSTAEVLKPAAVLGEQFDVPVLGRMVGRAEIDVVRALEPMMMAQLVAPVEGRSHRFAFAHALIREAILARLPLIARSRLHWQAGKALETVLAAEPARLLGEIAHHLTAGVHSGDPGQAIIANIRAGQHDLSTLAFEEARNRFAAATELLETAGVTDPQLTVDAWLGLGRAGGALADAELQRRCHLRAATVARRQGWPRHLVRSAVGVAVYHLGGVPEPPSELPAVDGEPSEAEVVKEALAVASDEPTVEGCLLLALQTINDVIVRDSVGALRRADATDDAARQLDDPSATAAALLARSWALIGTPRSKELRTSIERALALRVATDPGVIFTYLLPLLIVPALREGNRAELASVRRRVAAERGVWGGHVPSALQTWDVAVALSRGQFGHAHRLLDAFPGAPEWMGWGLVVDLQRAVAWIEQGRFAELRRTLEAFMSETRLAALATRAQLAYVCAGLGDRGAAARHVEVLREHGPDRLAGGLPRTLRYLAELAAWLHDPDLARQLLPRLSAFAGQMLVSYGGVTVEAAADRLIGQVLLALGRIDDAVERLVAAEAFERSSGADALATRTAYWHARARLTRADPGDRTTAEALLTRARTDALRLCMPRLVEDAAQLFADPRAALDDPW